MNELDFVMIGAKIKERRLSCGYTQEYVSQRLDVNPSHISNIECGRANPSLTALVNIANTLECSVDYFICHEYSYYTPSCDAKSLDDQIIEKLENKDIDYKKRVLKMLSILE